MQPLNSLSRSSEPARALMPAKPPCLDARPPFVPVGVSVLKRCRCARDHSLPSDERHHLSPSGRAYFSDIQKLNISILTRTLPLLLPFASQRSAATLNFASNDLWLGVIFRTARNPCVAAPRYGLEIFGPKSGT